MKNNQQPPISFWHAKEGTLKKSTKCCAKLSSILFQVGYTLCLSPPAFISTSTSLCLHHPQSCNALASWSAGLRVKQRWWLDSGWLKKKKNYYKNVVECVCVCVCKRCAVPFSNPTNTRIHTHKLHIYCSSWYYGKCSPAKSANEMRVHKFHYKKVSNIRVLYKTQGIMGKGLRESTWIIPSWLEGTVYVWVTQMLLCTQSICSVYRT